MKRFFVRLFLISLCILQPSGDVFGAVVIKLGTLAPEGTPFHDVLLKINQAWKQTSNNQVSLRIYPGGVSGSEPDMLRKMRLGGLQAGTFSSLGIIPIDATYAVLQVPGMVSSYDELDYIRDQLAPTIEQKLAEKGYVVLSYGEIGSIQFFTRRKITTIQELMKLKISAYATDEESKRIWAKAGFNIVDLPTSEVLTALQTGLIDGFINSPAVALSLQWFAKAKYMLQVNYGIALAATVVTQASWNKIDPALAPKLREQSFAIVKESRAAIRDLDKKAIQEMVKYGLEIYTPPVSEQAQWQEPLVRIYPEISGELVPVPVFQKALSLRDEFRKPRSK